MAELNFDTTVNYQKIFDQDSYPATINSPNFESVNTIFHLLGYVPNVRVWFTNAAGEISTAVHTGFGDALNAGGITTYLDFACNYEVYSNRLVIRFVRGVTSGTVSTTIYYRIYWDSI